MISADSSKPADDVCNTRIDETTLMSDFKDNEDFYEVTLTDQLGQAGQLTAPQAASALIRATPVKAVARKATCRCCKTRRCSGSSHVFRSHPGKAPDHRTGADQEDTEPGAKFWVPAGQDVVIGKGMRISGGLSLCRGPASNLRTQGEQNQHSSIQLWPSRPKRTIPSDCCLIGPPMVERVKKRAPPI
jgi:hypothetical protein